MAAPGGEGHREVVPVADREGLDRRRHERHGDDGGQALGQADAQPALGVEQVGVGALEGQRRDEEGARAGPRLRPVVRQSRRTTVLASGQISKPCVRVCRMSCAVRVVL